MTFLVRKTKTIKSYNGQKEKSLEKRLWFVVFVFAIVALAIIYRLVILQLLGANYYKALASDQHEIFRKLNPVRGKIYLQTGELTDKYYSVATNVNKYVLYAVPKEIDEVEMILKLLAELFSLPTERSINDGNMEEIFKDENLTEEEKKELEEKVALYLDWELKLKKKDDPYEPLMRLVEESTIEKIKELNLKGIGWTKEPARFYPEKNIGSTLLGFVGKQAESGVLKGYYGIEGCYNSILSGESGFLRTERDRSGNWIAVAGQDYREAMDGQNIFLTIDKSIQYFACKTLDEAVKKHQAEKGNLIVMDPKTGRILAMCSSPDFDPNYYNKIDDLSVFNNGNISEAYESGSVFKPITMAMGINMGLIDPFTGYNDTGVVEVSGHKIRNSDLKANGWQTMTQVLEKSLNTGVIYVAKKVGKTEFKNYAEDFGFGKKSGIDLCGEAEGNLKALEKREEIYLYTASFGQGITTTPIQLVRAYSAIVNEGKMMRPYVIEKIEDSLGTVISSNEPKLEKQVISAETAKLLSGMLVSVIKNGHTKNAAIPGYYVGGKTGTAQIPDFEKGGYSNETVHTFVGFAPFENPRFVMLVKVDKPKDVQFAEGSVSPVFSKVGKFILDYLGVPKEVK